MKNNILSTAKLLGVLVAVLFLNGCKKSNPNNPGTYPSQPEAKPAFNTQSGGVYKGTLTGSSGYVVVSLQATTPFIIYKFTSPAGNLDSLFTTALVGWTSGQAISRALFTGASGSKFWFSVNGDGSSPTIDSVYIPSHSGKVYANIGKETSTTLIKIYQGTATPIPNNPPNSGCYNAIINIWRFGTMFNASALVEDPANNQYYIFAGSSNGNQMPMTLGGEGGTLTISPDENSISGVFGPIPGGRTKCNLNLSLTRIY